MNIVQIGTNRAYDDVTEMVNLYSDHIEKLILVEPLEVHHDTIKTCYQKQKEIYIEPSAITDDLELKELTFYYHKEDGPGFEVAGTSKEHILKHSIFNPKLTEEGIVTLKVPCITLNQLFDKYNLTDIDVLYIDVEGLDDKLVYSLDLEKYNITNIIYEHLHIDAEKVIKYLEDKGYSTIRNYGHNGWSHAAVKQ
jgi:FkbM family methyltransferase